MSHKRILKMVALLCIGAILLTFSAAGCGQQAKTPKYPTKPIQIIVPYPPGGTSDIGARMIAAYASEKLGQPVQVVNKAGGAGSIGQKEALSAPADGYTFVLESVMVAAMPLVLPDCPFELEKRTTIGIPVYDPVFVIVPSSSNVKTLSDLIDQAKKDPQNFRWAATGATGVGTFVVGLILNKNGIDIHQTKMVAFQGSAPCVTAAAGGQVDATAGMAAEIKGMVDAGKVRPIVVIAEKRHPAYPDVPTIAEAGYPDFPKAFTIYYNGISGPAGLPDYVVNTWAKILRDATEDPKFRKQAEDANKMVLYWGPEEFRQNLMKNHEMFKELVKTLGIEAK